MRSTAATYSGVPVSQRDAVGPAVRLGVEARCWRRSCTRQSCRPPTWPARDRRWRSRPSIEELERVERIAVVEPEVARRSRCPRPTGTTASVPPISAATPASTATVPSPPHATTPVACFERGARERRDRRPRVGDTWTVDAAARRARRSKPGEQPARAPATGDRVHDRRPALGRHVGCGARRRMVAKAHPRTGR